MKNLNFDNGIREFCINDNPNAVIRICVTDFSLPARFAKMHDEISDLLGELKGNPQAIAEADKEIRVKINELLGGDVSDALFGSVNCLTLAGGTPIVVNCLEALLPIVSEAVQAETAASKSRIEKYTAQAAQLPQE